MLTTMPVAGPVWEVVTYLIGLQRLGYDVHYVEAHRKTPHAFIERPEDDGPVRAAAFLDRALSAFGLGDRWAYQSVLGGDRLFGISETRLAALYRDAALIINLNGGTDPLPEHSASGRLVYLETDPVRLELALAAGDEKTQRIAAAHGSFATYGLNLGEPDCPLPMPAGIEFLRTPPPVLLDLWGAEEAAGAGAAFTTVGNLGFAEEADTSRDKRGQLLEHIDLPRRTAQPLELALGRVTPEDRVLLEQHGWRLRSASEVSEDPQVYRDYIAGSRAELTVVKDEYVRYRTGWFSERSAGYLAASRPVVMQDTGFGARLPTGRGLLAFSTTDEALAAIEDVNRDYAAHSSAALEIAREFLDASVVLPRLLEHFGLAS
jgi:hypothetical protein